MKRSIVVMGLLCTLLLSGGLAWAQMGRGMNLPKFFGDWNVSVGAGASYLIENEKDKPSHMDVAITGQEKVDGQDGYWMEMSIDGARKDRSAIIKYLFVKLPDEVSIKRVIVKPGDGPAMEMPMNFMSGMGSNLIEKESFNWKNKSKRIGTETVSTPAGSFSCEHYQTTDKGETHDVWISNKVAPYGLVKSKSPKTTLTLQKVLTGQKSKITETPQKMDLPFGNRQ